DLVRSFVRLGSGILSLPRLLCPNVDLYGIRRPECVIGKQQHANSDEHEYDTRNKAARARIVATRSAASAAGGRLGSVGLVVTIERGLAGELCVIVMLAAR